MANKVIYSKKAADLAEFMKKFIKSGEISTNQAIDALKEVLIQELEDNGIKVKRKNENKPS